MVRKATINDSIQIAKIVTDGWKNAYKGILTDEFLNNINYSENEIKVRKCINSENKEFTSFIIVYEEGNEIKGFSYYGKNISGFSDGYGEVIALYVDINCHRQGIGRKMVDWIKNELKKQGFDNMIIWCLKDNLPSISFYKAIGGIVSDERDFEVGGRSYKEVGIRYKL